MDDSGENFGSKELAGWDPTEGLQLQLGTWSSWLTLRVAGLSGHMDSRLSPGALISALTLCQPETGWGKSEKQRQVLQKGGTEEKVGAEQLKFFQPSLRSRGGLGPSEKGQARPLLELYTFSIGKNRET